MKILDEFLFRDIFKALVFFRRTGAVFFQDEQNYNKRMCLNENINLTESDKMELDDCAHHILKIANSSERK